MSRDRQTCQIRPLHVRRPHPWDCRSCRRCSLGQWGRIRRRDRATEISGAFPWCLRSPWLRAAYRPGARDHLCRSLEGGVWRCLWARCVTALNSRSVIYLWLSMRELEGERLAVETDIQSVQHMAPCRGTPKCCSNRRHVRRENGDGVARPDASCARLTVRRRQRS